MSEILDVSQNVVYDARWLSNDGIGRFTREVLHYLPINKSISGLNKFHLLEQFWLSKEIAVAPAGLFFSTGFNPPLLSPKPFIFTIHDLIYLHVSEEATWQKRLYFECIVKPACHRAARVLTVSQYSKQQIVQWAKVPEDKVVVVGCGVSSHFSPVGRKHHEDIPYFLYVGAKSPHKNIPRLLKALALLNCSNVQLILSGKSTSELDQLIYTLGVQDQVKFIGFIPDEVLPEYYRGALGLVFPSLFEGFGLPALEAMACGTPVITSNTTSLPEVVGESALTVDPYSEHEIADAMRKVLNDSSLRAALREQGLSRVQQFTWSKVALRIQNVFDDILKTK